MSPTSSFDPRVDAYIAKAKPFAQPILLEIRELVHKACPAVEETIKWSRPFFEYKGAILGNMSAFKEHCSFGFWGEEIGAVLREAKALQDGRDGLARPHHHRQMTCPPDKQMLSLLIRQATSFIDTGNYTSPIAARNKVVKAPKPAPETHSRVRHRPSRKTARRPQPSSPNSAPAANANTSNGSPKAKRPETRDKRIATADRVDRRRQTAQLEIPELLKRALP